jgi:hypothetical protein
MKLLQTIVFFGLYALASATLPEGSHRSMAEPEEMSQENGSVRKRTPKELKANNLNTYRARRNKASNGGGPGGDNGGGNGDDQAFGDNSPCMLFQDIPQRFLDGTTVDNPEADIECLVENACNTGCCRIFTTFLVCDLGGNNQDFDTLQVCDDGLQQEYVRRSFFDSTPLLRRWISTETHQFFFLFFYYNTVCLQ